MNVMVNLLIMLSGFNVVFFFLNHKYEKINKDLVEDYKSLKKEVEEKLESTQNMLSEIKSKNFESICLVDSANFVKAAIDDGFEDIGGLLPRLHELLLKKGPNS